MKFPVIILAVLGLVSVEMDAADADATLRFFEEKAKSDPDDITAQNQLAERYLVKLRETGRLEFLPKARAAADASLKSVPAAQNPAALMASAQVALAEHRFAEAARIAAQYNEQRPHAPPEWETLFDAQLELGAYGDARKSLDKLRESGADALSFGTREALWARLHGQDAGIPLDAAIAVAREAHKKRPQPAPLVWCLLQRGEVAFSIGDFAGAEKWYTEALAILPGDWKAQSHMAELRAAEGKFEEALVLLNPCIESTGRPELLQAAGDIEVARNRSDAARIWHDRALASYVASAGRGEKLFIHHLAGFYCDVRPNPAEAVRLARADLADRGGVHAQATLAWALHLDGQLQAAAKCTAEALSTNTKDAHILHQGGLIFTASGDLARGRTLLRAAEAANPRRSAFHFHR